MMADSLIRLRLPAVIWLASTGLLVADHDTGFTPAIVDAVAWLVFLGGVAYFFNRLIDAGGDSPS